MNVDIQFADQHRANLHSLDHANVTAHVILTHEVCQ